MTEYTSSEDYRHQCEVRYVLKLAAESTSKAAAYLGKIYERDPERCQRLKRDCRAQYDNGNTGEKGDWR